MKPARRTMQLQAATCLTHPWPSSSVWWSSSTDRYSTGWRKALPSPICMVQATLLTLHGLDSGHKGHHASSMLHAYPRGSLLHQHPCP